MPRALDTLTLAHAKPMLEAGEARAESFGGGLAEAAAAGLGRSTER